MTCREELNAIIAERFAECDSAEVMKVLDETGIANAGVNNIEDFLAHPVLAGRERWRDVRIPGGTAVPALLPPVDLAGSAPHMDAVPAVGDHTDRILAELGHSTADIAALRADHVL